MNVGCQHFLKNTFAFTEDIYFMWSLIYYACNIDLHKTNLPHLPIFNWYKKENIQLLAVILQLNRF